MHPQLRASLEERGMCMGIVNQAKEQHILARICQYIKLAQHTQLRLQAFAAMSQVVQSVALPRAQQ